MIFSAPLFDTDHTCAVTGHRTLSGDFDEVKTENIFISLIEQGYNNFLIGMAIGFDTACFKILEKIRNTKPIKITACIPCISQATKFTFRQRVEYEKMLLSADDKIYVCKEYNSRCMFLRNMFMVDNASVLVAYLNKDKGGAFNTVNYAKR